MSETLPLMFQWDGEAMKVVARHRAEADQRYVIGEVYRGDFIEERSMASHNHFFAVVSEAWKNLPERLADLYPTPDALRKRALIRAGYRDQEAIVCDTHTVAERVAAFMRPKDPYAVVIVKGPVVLYLTAQSQSMKAMGKQRFQESKDAVLAELAKIIETTPDALSERARQAQR